MNGDIRRPGNWLAHYTTATAAFEHILLNRRLRMSPYRRMNDPIENKRPPIAFDVVEHHRAWTGRPRATGQRLIEEFTCVYDGMRVISFTHDIKGGDSVFDCCWARPRMWDQYGDKHRGVCLVFSRAELDAELRASLGALAPSYYVNDVRYTRWGIFDHEDAPPLGTSAFSTQIRRSTRKRCGITSSAITRSCSF